MIDVHFRVQFLDALADVIRELAVDTRNAVTAKERIRAIEWPLRAVTLRVLDADAAIVHSETKGNKR